MPDEKPAQPLQTFVYATHIVAPKEKLWEALTSKQVMPRYWMGRHFESDWQKGSSLKNIAPDGNVDWHGEILEIDPPSVLAFTFCDPNNPEHSTTPTQVEILITPSGPATNLLKLTHSKLSEAHYRGLSVGWPAILSSLKSLAETGQPIQFFWQG